ncbi:hypothetical protein [Burkholderia cepacia]|uniref:hypothetical protein n=1 Tax=Burkholderia cepacia TaxID=292 RepID=UPI00159EDC22
MSSRAENSHQPKRELKRRVRGFRLPERAQAFLPCFAPIRQHIAFSRHLLRASRHRKQLRDAIRNPAPFHRHYPESVRRRLHGSFNSVVLSCQRQRGKAHRTPPSNQKQSRPQAGFVMRPRATTRTRHFMQAEASFPTAITACSISGDHGLL